jgi:hypothetical protein
MTAALFGEGEEPGGGGEHDLGDDLSGLKNGGVRPLVQVRDRARVGCLGAHESSRGPWETPEVAPRLEKGGDGCVPEHPCGGLGDLAFVYSP